MQLPDRYSVSRTARLGATAGACLVLGSLLGGCMMDKGIDLPGRDQVTDPIRDADLRARWTGPVGGTSGAAASARAAQPMVFPGVDQAPAPEPTSRTAATAATTRVAAAVDGDVVGEDGVELNFDNADLPTVVKSVLGDGLGLNYVIDPRVQGTITLASAQRIPRKDVLPIFENVLRILNAAVLREDNLVRIVPLPEAAGAGASAVGAGQPGYGVSIVSLRYVSAAAIAKTAESFLSRPGAVRVDQARNVLLIQGTASERQAALGVIGTLDVEWLRNQSVALYPLKSTAPETMIRELEKVFDTADGGQGQGVIKFQPVSRMNAVLAVSKNSKVLERATQWVRRLDRSDPTGTTVRVYSLRFGNARSIARILNEMFVGRSSQSAQDNQTSPTAPGQNGATSRLDSLGSGTLTNSSGSSNSPSGTTTQGGTDTSGNTNSSGKTQVGFADRKDDDQDTASAGGSGPGLGSLPRGVFQNVRITADKSTNSVMVYSNQEDYLVIERALEQLDRPRLQVAVDAMVAEVTLTDQLQYGVQAYLTSANAGAGQDKGSVGLFGVAQSAAQTSLLARVLPGFNLLLGAEANPKLVLNALSTLTSVKVLSAPSLVVADNEPAILEVGDQVPISTGSTVTGLNVVSSISRQNTGIILKVLPHVHPNGSIELEIEQEVSNVVNPGGASAQNLTPTISQRRIHSTVGTSSGQTVLLGGLIKEDDERNVAGLPGLNQIKYLGDLLSQKSDTKTRSEIIVFVTTKLVRNAHDAQVVAEEFRERLDSMRRSPSILDTPAPVARK